MRIPRRRAAMSAQLRSGRTLIAPSVPRCEVRRRSQAPLTSKLAVLCQKTFTVMPSGRYAPECTVSTVGNPSTARRWVGRLLQLIAAAWLRSFGSLPDCSASTRNACSAWACASSLKREGRQNANPVALAGRITTAAPIPTHRRSLHQPRSISGS